MKASQQAIERGVKDCLFVDYKRRSGHFDVTTVASIKEITEKVPTGFLGKVSEAKWGGALEHIWVKAGKGFGVGLSRPRMAPVPALAIINADSLVGRDFPGCGFPTGCHMPSSCKNEQAALLISST